MTIAIPMLVLLVGIILLFIGKPGPLVEVGRACVWLGLAFSLWYAGAGHATLGLH